VERLTIGKGETRWAVVKEKGEIPLSKKLSEQSKVKIGTILDKNIVERLKERAAREGKAISTLIEDAVRKYDLEDRLIDYAIMISDLVEQLPNNKLCIYLGGQLIGSGTSPALNYGEAQSAESTNDFIHKLKIILKELRESNICLKILLRCRE
jgi:four helix bundle protein